MKSARLIQRFVVSVSCLCGILFAPVQSVSFALESPPVAIQSIDVNDVNGITKVVVSVSRSIPFAPIELRDPPEMILEFLTSDAVCLMKDRFIRVRQGPLQSIRIVGIDPDAEDGEDRVDRLVFQLKDSVPYRAYQESSSIIIEFGVPSSPPLSQELASSGAAASLLATPSAGQPMLRAAPSAPSVLEERYGMQRPSPLPPTPPPTLSGAGGQAYDLLACQQVAEMNHRPLQISYEEVKLASLKLQEARRSLYPTASVKWQESNSEVAGGLADSLGRRFTLEMQQPLYTGGQLQTAHRQAKLNVKIAKLRYEKVRADLAYDVAKVYYTLAAAQRKVRFYEAVLSDTEQVESLMTKRYERGLSRNLELLSAQSSRYQVIQQIETGRSEIALAVLSVQNALNVEYPVAVLGQELDRDGGVTVAEDECVRLAQANRLDLQLNEMLVKFSDYGRRIMKARGGPQVNLNGLVGHGAENFDTEDLEYQNEWFVGLEVKVPWGLNAVKDQVVAQDRLPSAGQVDSTKFFSNTAEMVLLDKEGYAMRGEKQNAEIEYQKALDQLIKTEQTVTYEVRESFLNYQKARRQLEGVRQRRMYGEEQVRVLRGTADVNEVPSSDVIRAVVELADIQASEVQARAEQWTAIAALNKAVGIAGYFH